jgi:hypothetical protein
MSYKEDCPSHFFAERQTFGYYKVISYRRIFHKFVQSPNQLLLLEVLGTVNYTWDMNDHAYQMSRNHSADYHPTPFSA